MRLNGCIHRIDVLDKNQVYTDPDHKPADYIAAYPANNILANWNPIDIYIKSDSFESDKIWANPYSYICYYFEFQWENLF